MIAAAGEMLDQIAPDEAGGAADHDPAHEPSWGWLPWCRARRIRAYSEIDTICGSNLIARLRCDRFKDVRRFLSRAENPGGRRYGAHRPAAGRDARKGWRGGQGRLPRRPSTGARRRSFRLL